MAGYRIGPTRVLPQCCPEHLLWQAWLPDGRRPKSLPQLFYLPKSHILLLGSGTNAWPDARPQWLQATDCPAPVCSCMMHRHIPSGRSVLPDHAMPVGCLPANHRRVPREWRSRCCARAGRGRVGGSPADHGCMECQTASSFPTYTSSFPVNPSG